MFERFTEGARGVVTGAVGHSERMAADSVTEEHMLLALLDQEGTRTSFAFAALGIRDRRPAVEQSLADARRHGGLSKADADALAGIGIDVDRIVSKVEEAHGEGAMRAGGTAGRPRRWWSGHRGLTPGAKGVLERSLRIAVGRGDRHIGDEHILLALAARPGVVSEVLSDHGATYTTLERTMFGDPGTLPATG
ncbi:Clp protease N-terminal domain-containing protein [Streptomyces odonnellii]|uniref:Clp protease N-terminal domain-containing protein n=1 Tax=Streptomyces odonnellii TaxID=1417980 RepID=UPI000626271D|nr:Clp protease N-terminal domain-containing protein [Streptomyces odonnellii]